MHRCCEGKGNFSSLLGDGFTRRRFMQVAGTGLVASYFADVASAKLLESATSVSPTLHKTAKNCILIFLSGAPSHVDTWDLKEGTWTPADFAPTTFGAIRWPQGLLPNTANHLDKLAIIRSGLAWAAVHNLAQEWAQIARNPGGATGSIAPHIGAVVSLESQLSRQPSDILPGFVSINQVMAGSGYLAAQYTRYGATSFGASLIVARNLVNARRGTRFVQVTLGGWDHHSNIYAKTGQSLYTNMKQ